MRKNWRGKLLLAGWLKVATALGLFLALSSGGLPNSLGDFTFFALALALPVLSAFRHFRGEIPMTFARFVFSVSATVLLALIVFTLLGDCGGDGLSCEVLAALLWPLYAAAEIGAIRASGQPLAR